MEDYTGNAKRQKEGLGAAKAEKKVEKVVTGEVVIQKKSIGRKIKDIFVEADFRSVTSYVVHDVLIPAMRNMIVDSTTKGIERVMYGTQVTRGRYGMPGPRVTYNTPISRPYSGVGPRQAPPLQIGSRSAPRQTREDVIVATREEAEIVLERLSDIIDKFDVATVADLYDLLGLPSTHIDNKWGWVFIGDASVRQIRDGFIIDLPQPDPIQ